MEDSAQPAANHCIACGIAVPEGEHWCPACGAVQNASADPIPPLLEKVSIFREAERNGLWRAGSLLVAHKLAVFPARCLKTNQPTPLLVRHQFYWLHPAYIFLFAFLCVCLIPWGIPVTLLLFAFILRRARLDLPFTEAVIARQRRTILIHMTVVAAVFAFFPLAALTNEGAFAVIGGLALLGLVFFSAISNFAALVTVDRIANDFVYIRGVCPEFLRQLPYVPRG